MSIIQENLYTLDLAPVIVVSQVFTGKIPTEAKFNELVPAVGAQEKSYGDIGVSYPQLAGYEALGKGFAVDFPAVVKMSVGSSAFFTEAYQTHLGRAATDLQVQHFVDQETYFRDLYTADTANFTPESAALQARGAAFGQLLGQAAMEPQTVLGKGLSGFVADYDQGGIEAWGQPLDTYGPDVVTVPGGTVYVPVPTPVEPAHDIVRTVDGVLDRTSEKASSPGEIYIGSGGNMNTGYQFTEDRTASIEVGFKVHDRGGADRLSTSVDADGTVHIDALAGAQAGVSTRGATALDVSINLGLAETTDTKFLITMGLDTDETIATDFNVSTYNAAGNYWANALGAPVMGNDGARNGTGHLIQDSTNAAFASWLGTADAPEGTYDAYVSVLNTETGVEVRQEIVLHLYDMI